MKKTDFVTAFEDFGHHMQVKILGCKGKNNPDNTKLRNEIKQFKSEIDKLKKEACEKDSTVKVLTDTAVGIEKTGWQI